MAKQTEISYESTKEWKDFQTGGTRIDASDLSNMEAGITDAWAGVDELRTKRLPTYLVAENGDTATQDVYLADILGPCLILDLSTRTTYYDDGEDGEGHERKAITSGDDIDALRDSVSQKTVGGITANVGGQTVDCEAVFLAVTNDLYIAVPVSSRGNSIALAQSGGIYYGSVVISAPENVNFSAGTVSSIQALTRNGMMWVLRSVISVKQLTITVAASIATADQPYSLMVRTRASIVDE